MRPFVVDSGPLVAWFCPPDAHHASACEIFTQLPVGVIGCETVLAEVCHLVANDGVARGKLLEFVERGRLAPVSVVAEFPLIRKLLDQYADAPMDFADACVVRLAELHADATVCTTDSHFRFFRKQGREPIPLLAPFAGEVASTSSAKDQVTNNLTSHSV